MGYQLEFNCLLKLPKSFNLKSLKANIILVVEKEGERLYPLNIPIEICDNNYQYLGKVIVTKLTLEKQKTILKIKVLKIFSPQEAKVFTDNFIK